MTPDGGMPELDAGGSNDGGAVQADGGADAGSGVEVDGGCRVGRGSTPPALGLALLALVALRLGRSRRRGAA